MTRLEQANQSVKINSWAAFGGRISRQMCEVERDFHWWKNKSESAGHDH